MYVTDTIAAVATPPGSGGVGIVRISGPQSRAIAEQLFRATTPQGRWISHRLYQGSIVDAEGRVVDEALAVLMLAPRSYTGEDVLELHCHGSPILLRRILALALSNGSRLAEPGEFTRRAFLNGKLDLAQAEAVVDIVGARGNAAAAAAAAQLSGGLSRELAAIRETLVQLKSLLEAQIDFSEEDFTVDPSSLRSLIDNATAALEALIHSYRRGKIIRDGVRVVIVGKPNVGKSSLLNALLAEERAIVTPVPGTTRDTIEELADFGGIPVLLTDTAGLRPVDKADAVEQLGMVKTSEKIAEATVCLLVMDASSAFDEDDEAVFRANDGRVGIVVLNKIDLPGVITATAFAGFLGDRPVIQVSAKTREGLDQVRQAVVGAIEGERSETPALVITNLRHHDMLAKAAISLDLGRQSIDEGRSPDVVAVDVQDAIDHIGAITGVITNEEILDRIFSQFCIGK